MNATRLGSGLAVAAAALVVLVVPTTASAVQSPQSHIVSAVPAAYTPNITDGRTDAITQVGSTIVLGGSFTSVTPHGSTTAFPDQFLTAFTAGTGARVAGFAPTVDGDVDTLAPGPTSGTVYVGGTFSTIDGVTSKMALISTTTGAIVPGWTSPKINGAVNSIVLSGGQLYVGGYFATVGGKSRVGLAVLNPTTGAVSPTVTPSFVGHHNFNRLCIPSATKHCASAGTGIKTLDINPAGNRLIAIGNFTTAGGLARDQIALIDLAPTSVTVDTTWATAAYTASCIASAYDVYMRDVQFSLDGSYFVVVATGGGAGSKNSDGTPTSCDSTARYETSGTGSDVRPTWIDYTGNDTFLSVAPTTTAIYVGGHERWVNNSKGSDSASEGAVPRPGLVAFDPANGMPLAWNPGRNPRGAGAYSLLATSDGLYVGSDTDFIGNHLFERKKIAFFPLAGGTTLASNSAAALPGNVFLLGSGTSSSTARSVSWDGSSTPGTPSTVNSVDWSTARGAFEINNEVYYGSTDGNFYQRSFDGTTFGPAVAIDPYDDPVWSTVDTGSGQTYRGVKSNFYGEMSSLTSMFYSNGRVYYTLTGKTQMFWRWFEPDSGVMGADEFTVSDGQNWSHVSGAFLSGSTLYFADSVTKALFKVPFIGGQASGTPTVANASIDWTSRGAFVSQGGVTPVNQPPTAAFSANCAALACSFNAGASHDPDGTIATYSWTFGDGTSSQSTTPTATHTYTAAGNDVVTLTVTDNGGATAQTSQTVTPSTGGTNPVTFAGVSAVDVNATSAAVSVPATTQPGDALLLFESYASTAAAPTTPAGWTAVGATSHSNLTSAVFERSAQAGDAGTSVAVTFPAKVQASLTLADYASTAGAVEMEASSTASTTASHTSPTITGLSNGSLAVTFWTDKATGTTAWTPPAGITKRSDVYGTGGGAVSDLLVDSGSPVSGSYGGLVATTNATSGSAAQWTIALAGS
jgi:PKD repeat protein